MKCSLLTLSTFIDDEMPVERHAEVDAHLVGCPRCTAGVASLREEKLRVAQLARVRVPAPSAAALLESIGVSSAPVGHRSVSPRVESAPVPANRPWLEARSSAALPWTPTRPAAMPALSDEEMSVPRVPADVQPDLPFEHAPAAGPPPVAMPLTGTGSLSVDDEEGPASAAAADEEVPADAWELHVPGYPGAGHPRPAAVSSSSPPTAAPPPPPPLAAPAAMDAPSPVVPAPPVPVGPPRRAGGAAGRGLWNRARDSIAVRLALAGGDRGVEDTAEIVTGPAQPRRVLPPAIAGFESPAGRDRPAPPPGAAPGTAPAPARPAAPQRAAAPDPDRSFDWNAFGASGYPAVAEDSESVAGRSAAHRRPLGRHSRALRREPSTAAARVKALAGSLAGAVQQRRSALQRHGAALGRSATAAGGRRLPMALSRRAAIGTAVVVALLVVAFLATRGGTPHPGSTAVRQTPPPVRASAVATAAPTAAPQATAPPALASPLTLGGGGSGFQVVRLRYGSFGGAQRVVFDLGATGPAASGSPRVVIGLSDATTLLVTFSAVVPAGAIAPPPSGGVIRSVTLISSSSTSTVYRLTLAKPATPSAFYLTGPLRLVLDVR